MRSGARIILAIALFAGGCASQHHQPTTQPMVAQFDYQPSSAGSLVFDPPVTAGQPPLELSRDDRTPSAFVGYEQLSTTYFYLRTDDRLTNDGSDRYERRMLSEKVGVTYR